MKKHLVRVNRGVRKFTYCGEVVRKYHVVKKSENCTCAVCILRKFEHDARKQQESTSRDRGDQEAGD